MEMLNIINISRLPRDKTLALKSIVKAYKIS